MQPRRIKRFLPFAVLLAAAGAGAGLLHEARGGRLAAAARAPAPAPARGESPVAAGNRPGARDAPPAIDLPSRDLPEREAIAALLPLAERGRADAMRELSMRLIRCSRAQTGPDEEIRQGAVKRFYWYHGREPSSDAEVAQIAAEVEASARQRDDCDGVDAGLVGQRIAWLEKAARAGDPKARLDYAGWGLQDMGREEVLMQPDEVERRRQIAGEALQQALAAGDCDALSPLAQAYGGERGRYDWIFRADPALAVAYSEADLRRQERAQPPELAVTAAETAWKQLDPARLDAARRRGDALYARYCTGAAPD